MDNVQLSVCIPTYNFGEFIGQTLASIIEQANDQVEIVIGDGASTDNTLEVVKSYQKIFPRLTYCNFGKKGGVDLDVVKTVALARGEYCWLMSADDVLEPGAIDRILAELKYGHAIYLCNRIDCDRNLKKIANRYWLSRKHGDGVFDFSDSQVLLEYLKSAQLLGALFGYLSSIIVHRDEWGRVSGNEIFLGSNYAHVQRLFFIAKAGGRVKYIHDPLVSARLFNDSFMANGIARRYMIDLDGFKLLSDHLFSEAKYRDAVKSTMRKEHKWYFLAGLRNKVSGEEWDELRVRLSYYGYSPVGLYLVKMLGEANWMMSLARNLRRALSNQP